MHAQMAGRKSWKDKVAALLVVSVRFEHLLTRRLDVQAIPKAGISQLPRALQLALNATRENF